MKIDVRANSARRNRRDLGVRPYEQVTAHEHRGGRATEDSPYFVEGLVARGIVNLSNFDGDYLMELHLSPRDVRDILANYLKSDPTSAAHVIAEALIAVYPGPPSVPVVREVTTISSPTPDPLHEMLKGLR